jgi:hypothetical protein
LRPDIDFLRIYINNLRTDINILRTDINILRRGFRGAPGGTRGRQGVYATPGGKKSDKNSKNGPKPKVSKVYPDPKRMVLIHF